MAAAHHKYLVNPREEGTSLLSRPTITSRNCLKALTAKFSWTLDISLTVNTPEFSIKASEK
jgi:hypothetical protein